MTLDDAYSSGTSRHAAAPRPRPAAFCCLARLRHVLASAAIAPSLLPPTAPPPWPSQSPPPSLRRHAASAIYRPRHGRGSSVQPSTAHASATLATAAHAGVHLTCSSHLRRAAGDGPRERRRAARVWAPQLRMRRQPTWLSSPPGVAIGRVPATSCAGACARCSAEEASCDAALARAQRVELAEQPAQTALASRCAGALGATQRGYQRT